jgi:LmbE family N-acetylglucosaminyl deacetylase
MAQSLQVLALFAHPDDAEFLCAGTLAHLADRGAGVYIATMTAGDCGSRSLPATKIAGIRRREARRAARVIAATYACLEERDLCIFYEDRTLRKVMELVRRANPSLVFTHSPVDYMVDHEITSRLAQTACFGSTAPNYRTVRRRTRHAAEPLHQIPHLYYAQPFGGRDILGNPVPLSLFVDISGTLERKEHMLACHESQLAWLAAQQGMADNRTILRQMAAHCGRLSGFHCAEGFRQHLGQGFPQDNPLAALLGSLLKDNRTGGDRSQTQEG